MDSAGIVSSLERAAALAGDLTPRVYARLFAEHPELAPLFRHEARDQAKGEMLARALEAILDCATDDIYGANLIAGEAVNHRGYDIGPEVFVRFFATIEATLRDVLGAEWTGEMGAAWAAMLARFETLASAP